MQESADPPAAVIVEPAIDRDERMWAMFCHLAAIVGGFLPVLPMTIAAFVCIPLVFLLIGIPLLLAILIFNLVMNIIGAVKANEGVHFRYPIRIEFFR